MDAARIAYREHYAELIAAVVTSGIAAGQLPRQNARLTAAALVGGCGEALVGPLSPLSAGGPAAGEILEALGTFIVRAVGAR